MYRALRYSLHHLPPDLLERQNIMRCFGCGIFRPHDMNLDVNIPGKTMFAKSERMQDQGLGRNIRKIRLRRDMTLQEFGKQFGDDYRPSPGIIAGWESGITMPTPLVLQRICEIGGIGLNSLFD
jgi:hypothetical protein